MGSGHCPPGITAHPSHHNTQKVSDCEHLGIAMPGYSRAHLAQVSASARAGACAAPERAGQKHPVAGEVAP